MFSCEFCEISKNTYFTEHVCVTASMYYTLTIALSWIVWAKNSLQNFHGLSPNQLTFVQNPNFPCVLQDKLPALEGVY